MGYLAAAVVLVAIVSSLNLLFTYGVIRRLREHTEQIAAISAGDGRGPAPMRDTGTEPDVFNDQVTTDGRPLTHGELRGMLVGFFAPGCAPCREQSRAFVERAAALGQERTLAIVAGTADSAPDLVRALESATRVLVEPDRGPVQAAFGVTGFPAFCLLDDDGRIKATGFAVGMLPELLTTP